MRYLVVFALFALSLLVPTAAADVNILDTVIVHTGDPGVTVLKGDDIMVGTQEDPCTERAENCNSIYVGTYVSSGACEEQAGGTCIGTVRIGMTDYAWPLIQVGCDQQGYSNCLVVDNFEVYKQRNYYNYPVQIYCIGPGNTLCLLVTNDREIYGIDTPVISVNRLNESPSYSCVLSDCYTIWHTLNPLCIEYSDNGIDRRTIICDT
jgi:hypothetical protein